MSPGPSHETPILLLLPEGTPLAQGLAAVLDRPEVRQIAWPAPWQLDEHGLDLCTAQPDLASIDRSTLDRAVQAWLDLARPEALDAHVARQWHAVDERVRDHYLGRSALAVLAGAFKMGAATGTYAPPAAFRRDRVFEASVPFSYRLAREPGEHDARAPAEEATLSFHPYDPDGVEARNEAGLDAGRGPVLEIYAYASGRRRHLELAQAVARAQGGWRVIDVGGHVERS